MQNLPNLLAVLLVAAALSGCEYIPFSGGKLEGQIEVPQPGWPEITEAEIIQIQTNPSEPYSVKLWVAVVNGKPYIHAGKNLATWVEHLEKNPELLLGFNHKLYELQAFRVTSQEEFNQFASVWEAKYGNPPRNLDITEVYAYRLEPR